MNQPSPRELKKALRVADIQGYLPDIDRIITALLAENLRHSTCMDYQADLKRFAAWLVLYAGAVSFSLVDLDTVRLFIEFLKNELLLAPSTINGYLAVIRKMYAVIQQKEVSKRILPDLVVDRKLPKSPSVEQVAKLLDACETTQALLFVTMLISTGMRLCELLNLRFCDILRDRKSIYIRSSKGRTDAYVPLTDRVVHLLTVYCQEYHASHPGQYLTSQDYIFFSRKAGTGTPETAYRIRRMWYEINEDAGLGREGFNIHSLRHYFALQLYLQSHDPFLVKSALHHKTYAATEKYVLLAITVEMQSNYINPGDMAYEKSREHSTETTDA